MIFWKELLLYHPCSNREKRVSGGIEKKKSDLGPARKLYTLNAKGEQELNDFWQRWSFLAEKMNEIKGQRNV